MNQVHANEECSAAGKWLIRKSKYPVGYDTYLWSATNPNGLTRYCRTWERAIEIVREEIERRKCWTEREILARQLLRNNTGWIWAEDNIVPDGSHMYGVFDGLNFMGGDYTAERAEALAKRCEMPIVIYLPSE